jgi:hypothetical protein
MSDPLFWPSGMEYPIYLQPREPYVPGQHEKFFWRWLTTTRSDGGSVFRGAPAYVTALWFWDDRTITTVDAVRRRVWRVKGEPFESFTEWNSKQDEEAYRGL